MDEKKLSNLEDLNQKENDKKRDGGGPTRPTQPEEPEASPKSLEQHIKDLNLLLMYLTGWEEESRKDPEKKVFRSWKGYLFEVLNDLEDDEFILQYRNTKSVIIPEEGITKAKALKKEYLE